MTKNMDQVKEQLAKIKQESLESIKDLKASDPFSDPEYANDNAAVDTDVREQDTHQRMQAEIDSLNERVINIDAAMQRIDKGTYGYCQRCNKEIPAARLELIPEAAYCVQCESDLKK
ncbi:MAG: TraR/DksA family transcriptional regulator [Weeksellaceae bacterium]